MGAPFWKRFARRAGDFPEAGGPGGGKRGHFFLACQKEMSPDPQRENRFGRWSGGCGPGTGGRLEVAEVGWPCPPPNAHNSLRSRRYRTASGGRARPRAGATLQLSASQRRRYRPSISVRQRRDRREQRAAGDAGRYPTTAYLQTPCYNESAFLWGSTPVSSWARPKKWGGFFPRRALPCAYPAEKRVDQSAGARGTRDTPPPPRGCVRRESPGRGGISPAASISPAAVTGEIEYPPAEILVQLRLHPGHVLAREADAAAHALEAELRGVVEQEHRVAAPEPAAPGCADSCRLLSSARRAAAPSRRESNSSAPAVLRSGRCQSMSR